jgi:DNA-binding response OmpR family regulator
MPHTVRFGRHRFDPQTGRLWSSKREVRLTPKAAAGLAVLVARAGQPVSRDELFASVWGDTGERVYEAELRRLRGELLLAARRDPGAAEACFASAREVARRQGARAFERRARSA